MAAKQNVLAEIDSLEVLSDTYAKRTGQRSPGRNALRRMRTAVRNDNVNKARQEMTAAISALNRSEYKKELDSGIRALTYAFRLWAN